MSAATKAAEPTDSELEAERQSLEGHRDELTEQLQAVNRQSIELDALRRTASGRALADAIESGALADAEVHRLNRGLRPLDLRLDGLRRKIAERKGRSQRETRRALLMQRGEIAANIDEAIATLRRNIPAWQANGRALLQTLADDTRRSWTTNDTLGEKPVSTAILGALTESGMTTTPGAGGAFTIHPELPSENCKRLQAITENL